MTDKLKNVTKEKTEEFSSINSPIETNILDGKMYGQTVIDLIEQNR